MSETGRPEIARLRERDPIRFVPEGEESPPESFRISGKKRWRIGSFIRLPEETRYVFRAADGIEGLLPAWYLQAIRDELLLIDEELNALLSEASEGRADAATKNVCEDSKAPGHEGSVGGANPYEPATLLMLDGGRHARAIISWPDLSQPTYEVEFTLEFRGVWCCDAVKVRSIPTGREVDAAIFGQTGIPLGRLYHQALRAVEGSGADG